MGVIPPRYARLSNGALVLPTLEATQAKIGGVTLAGGGAYTLTLPSTDGTSGQVLTTDGSGNLSWEDQLVPDTVKPLSVWANRLTAGYDVGDWIEWTPTGAVYRWDGVELVHPIVYAGTLNRRFQICGNVLPSAESVPLTHHVDGGALGTITTDGTEVILDSSAADSAYAYLSIDLSGMTGKVYICGYLRATMAGHDTKNAYVKWFDQGGSGKSWIISWAPASETWKCIDNAAFTIGYEGPAPAPRGGTGWLEIFLDATDGIQVFYDHARTPCCGCIQASVPSAAGTSLEFGDGSGAGGTQQITRVKHLGFYTY